MNRPASPASSSTEPRISVGRARLGLALAGLTVLVLAIAPASAIPAAAGPLAAAPHAVANPAGSAVHPALNTSSFNPPCYKIDTTVCVSIQSQNETDIIPPVGSFVSSQEPNATTDLTLVVKSHNPLNWSSNPKSGPNSPIALNVTGTLWNGDLYYSTYDGTIWHADSVGSWWSQLPTVAQNLTYPWWYTVDFSAKSSNGAPNFFPGMTVKWWIYLTYNVSVNATTTYTHHSSPVFQFTYSGAWPFSPYPGSYQYAGSTATTEDINVTQTPLQPNFNDSVTITLNSTQADVLSNATIGTNSYLDLNETLNGTLLATASFPFPVTTTGGFGAVSSKVVIPASYAQYPYATVSYTLSVRDVSNDLLVTPLAQYLVGGNGSFLSGVFVDDLAISATPSTVLGASSVSQAVLNPGQPLNLTLESRNPGTAISAAEVVYTLSYPLLHETAHLTLPFHRVTSIEFTATMPGLPLAAWVNFTLYAWDFTEHLEVSPQIGYHTPDLVTAIPTTPGNASFFYVDVYDNGSGSWVTGAHVQIFGLGGVYNVVTNTSYGVAYPNETGAPFTPLLIAANASYVVTVTDPYFVPALGKAPQNGINVTVLGLHSMVAHATLAAGSDYTVVQEGNSIVFWLNATTPPPAPSPTVSTSATVPIGAVVGVIAAFAVMFPLLGWWNRIRARRKAEEKRVTL